jgi:predicted DNA-binding transcriptional regulator AlpA
MTEAPKEVFLTAPQLFERWGVSHMFVVKRLRDDTDFPKPIYFGRHRRWKLSEIESYERVLAMRPKPTKKKDSIRAA